MSEFLARAFEIAAKVDPHQTAPNPRVGCVIVHDGKIISEGVHLVHGSAHAEVNCFLNLENSDFKPGLEIYLTLEPCDHFQGKNTPSCTELIISKNPKKLIVGALDPKFNGQNLEKIRQSGIEVEFKPGLEPEALNPFLDKYHSDSPYPYVCLKMAQSLNGKITSVSEPGLYITNKISRARVHETRAQYSVLLTSTETIIQDKPRLNVRLKPGLNKTRDYSDPQVVIVGNRPVNLDKFKDPLVYKTHDLKSVLKDLKTKGFDSVLLEVGQKLNTEFLVQDLVDEIQIFTAPIILPDTEKSTFVFPAQAGTQSLLSKFKLCSQQVCGPDFELQYKRF